MKTSVPCRVEFRSLQTGRLLGVDANGDGDFMGPGDILNQDLNVNTYPDLRVNPDSVHAIELLVFPATAETGEDSEIAVDLYVQSGDEWVHQGADLLVVR